MLFRSCRIYAGRLGWRVGIGFLFSFPLLVQLTDSKLPSFFKRILPKTENRLPIDFETYRPITHLQFILVRYKLPHAKHKGRLKNFQTTFCQTLNK